MAQPNPPSNNLWVGNNYSSGYSPNRNSGFMDQRGYMPQAMQQPDIPSMNNYLRVMGADSAIDYKVGPNSKVVLMDMNRPVFYVKTSDDSGYAETRAYEYHEIPLAQMPIEVQPSTVEYASKQDLESMAKSLEEFKKTIEELVMSNE